MRLGPDEFQILDHCEADLIAIGIASSSDLQQLVYFSLESGGERRFYVSLEAAPTEGSKLPYKDRGEFNNIDLETLTKIVAEQPTCEKSTYRTDAYPVEFSNFLHRCGPIQSLELHCVAGPPNTACPSMLAPSPSSQLESQSAIHGNPRFRLSANRSSTTAS